MTDLIIKFATKEQALAFATWLCEAGEQDYWMWGEIAIKHPIRQENPKDYVGSFDYHRNSNQFMPDMVIRTRGVLVSEDDPPTDPSFCQTCKGIGVTSHGYPEIICTQCAGTGIAQDVR